MSGSYSFNCPSDHRFCRGCAVRAVESKIENNETPTCPEPGCKYNIEFDEVKVLAPNLAKEYDGQLLHNALQQPGFVKCRCDFWMATASENVRERERVDCPSCNYVFCSLCNADYHYRCSCKELARYRNIWVAWMQQGRVASDAQKAQQETQTREFLDAQKKYQEDRDTAIKNLQTLTQDEQFKAQTSKRCPHCTRVVQKIEGCDAMVSVPFSSDFVFGSKIFKLFFLFSFSSSFPV